MKYIIIVFLILFIVFLYFYYNRKLELIKKQLILARNQSFLSKNKNSNYKKKIEDLSVNFSIPKYKAGTLKAKSYIYLSPISSSHILNCVDINTEILILDCANLNNETWFYVNIPNLSNINNRGWVNSKDISIFYTPSASVAK